MTTHALSAPRAFVRRVAALGTLLALAACAHAPARPAAPRYISDPVTAIVGATLWDGTGRPAVPNAVTLVRGERILCAGSAGECVVPPDARVVAARGQWIIPGLIETHAHLLFLTGGSAGEELAADLRDQLAQGITTVRDMGSNPEALLTRVRALPFSPRVYAMQLIAGRRFFYPGPNGRQTARGTLFRQPPAMTMQRLGWTPMLFTPDMDADSLVREVRATGAIGLKLYAQLDSTSVRRLTEAGHRAGLTVWGHAWVQPTSALEQALSGHDGVVHAAGLAGELFSPADRDTLVADGDLQSATALATSVAAAHDPRIERALDSLAARGAFLEPTLDATRHSVAYYDAKIPHRPTIQEDYVRAAAGFGMEVTREAVARGVRITAGSDHVAYGPARDRSSVIGELYLLVDSIGLPPQAALLAATRDAATAIGRAARQIGTVQAGRYADLVVLGASPLADIRNIEKVEWVMQNGRLLRPYALRSGIASRTGKAEKAGEAGKPDRTDEPLGVGHP
jgi:imidazolonepropionase-like amidohydrolase